MFKSLNTWKIYWKMSNARKWLILPPKKLSIEFLENIINIKKMEKIKSN